MLYVHYSLIYQAFHTHPQAHDWCHFRRLFHDLCEQILNANMMFLHIIHPPTLSSFHVKHVSEIGTSSVNWAQLSRFHLKTETESSLQNVVLKNTGHG
jgi:hypothetical protein